MQTSSITTAMSADPGLVRFLAPGNGAGRLGERRGPKSWGRARRRRSRWTGSNSTGSSRPGTASVRQPGSDRAGAGRVTKELLLGGDRRRPTLELALTVENRSSRAVDSRCSGSNGRSRCSAAGAIRRPGGRWPETGSGMTRAATATAVSTLAQGNDYVGVTVTTDDLDAGHGLVGAGGDDLELRERLRARLPGIRAAAELAPGDSSRRHLQCSRPRMSVTTAVDRADEEFAARLAPPLGGEPRPPRRPRPLLPALQDRSVQRHHPGRSVGGAGP